MLLRSQPGCFEMNEKDRLRQFYQRVLLTVGIIWGTLPFVTTPFIFRGTNDTTFDVIAAVCNSLTVMPACVLALWYRRLACVWLTANGVAITAAILQSHVHEVAALFGAAVPVLIAACLDMMEIRIWPGALARRAVPHLEAE